MKQLHDQLLPVKEDTMTASASSKILADYEAAA
jgi:hypothetical protein